MLSKIEYEEIIKLIKHQVVPAIGCTEPMAVALCVAKARQILGVLPEKIEVKLSANILKNAMGVGIPGTGMIGLPIAIALGALIGRPEEELEVLIDCNKKAVEKGKLYIAENRIDIKLEENNPDKLYINVICHADGHEAEAIIKGAHTNFVLLRKDDKILLNNKSHDKETENEDEVSLTLHKVYEFATTADIEDIDFILEAKRLNEAAADNGLHENYGHQLGKTMCSPLGKGIMGNSIFSEILSRTSCACDARMAGAMIPVMSNSGSGNQGIAATLPVVSFAEEIQCSEEQLTRALMLSHLMVIYEKQSLGRLSALCGCVVAATGASCGITYLMGGTKTQISYAIKNMIGNITGMICDGAKPSCALKVSSGVSTAMLSALMAMENKVVTSVEGIIDEDVDRTITNLTSIGSKGMDSTDRLVLDIMTSKSH